jgi:hypothetical protein
MWIGSHKTLAALGASATWLWAIAPELFSYGSCRNLSRRLHSIFAPAGAFIEYIAGRYVNEEKPTIFGAKNLKLKILLSYKQNYFLLSTDLWTNMYVPPPQRREGGL